MELLRFRREAIHEKARTVSSAKIPVNQNIRRLVDLFKNLGQQDLAIGELDKFGELLLDSGRRPDAVEVIEEIISLGPSNVEAYQKLLQQLRS